MGKFDSNAMMPDMRKFNSWSQLQTVLAVVETGSYRAASMELGITTSTVARHIEAVSQELKHPIFVPKGNGRELTDVGKELAKIASKTQTDLGFMIRNLETDKDFFGSLQISTLSFVGSEFLAQFLHLWRKDNPLAELVIDETDQTTAVERGEADVALRLTRPDTAGIARFKVANCHVGVFAPKHHKGNAWIGFSGSLDYLPEMKMARDFFQSDPVVRLDSYRAQARASISTGLPCVLPTCLAQQYEELHLIKRADAPLIVNRELWFLFYEKRKNDLAIIAARNWIKKIFPSANKCLCGECS